MTHAAGIIHVGGPMKVRIERIRKCWKAIVAGECRGVADTIPAVLRKADAAREEAEDESNIAERERRAEVEFFVDPSVSDALARRDAAISRSRLAANAVDAATREAIRAMAELGIGSRDNACIVGMSRSTVQRLATRRKAK